MEQGRDQTLPPADRASKTSPQAFKPSQRFIGVGWEWGRGHQRAGGGLLSPECPSLLHGGSMGQGKGRRLVLSLGAADLQTEI